MFGETIVPFGVIATFCVFEAALLSMVLPALDQSGVIVPLMGRAYKSSDVFDTTVYTWGTDYMISASLAFFVWRLKGSPLQQYSISIVSANALSTLIGGAAHQLAGIAESRVFFMNSSLFRCLWFMCISCVVLGGMAQGIMGSQLARSISVSSAFRISERIWIAIYFVAVAWVYFGGISHTRPAFDIFIAGAIQAPGCVYLFWNTFLCNSNKAFRGRRQSPLLCLCTRFWLSADNISLPAACYTV